jgi:hypothetical protein
MVINKPIKKQHLHGSVFVLLLLFVTLLLYQIFLMTNQEEQSFMLSVSSSSTRTKTPLGPVASISSSGVDQQSMMNTVLDKMKRLDLLHGTFFFEQHPLSFLNNNMNLDIDENEKESSTISPIQQKIIDDDDDESINIEREKERCARYGYDLLLPVTTNGDEIRPTRRRLFMGSLIADDSLEVMRAVGMETYNIFHTVSFIESNTTQSQKIRQMNYLPTPFDLHLTKGDDATTSQQPNKRLSKVRHLYGPKTKVHVDYYFNAGFKDITPVEGLGKGLDVEFFQREGSIHRWKMNGMTKHDVGIILDTDETFTRDFLRALQICDIPEFRVGRKQNCHEPKIIASTLTYESSVLCAVKKRWFHPDAIIGECIDGIGNSTKHRPAKRDYYNSNSDGGGDHHGTRRKGYGFEGNYSTYFSDQQQLKLNNNISLTEDGPMYYPLWQAVDFRVGVGGKMVGSKSDPSIPTGYHFHNFFDTNHQIHFKYRTYGHENKNAMDTPMWEFSLELRYGVDCAKLGRDIDIAADALDFHLRMPIYYISNISRNERHQLWLNIVKEDEERFNSTYNATVTIN